ncbi:MAG: DNA mismatch endonuclease Vsr [Armatimonadetes bacterium]|nr:DNA mismatch endonuclease Vsr [Armatimonadota bacterium]
MAITSRNRDVSAIMRKVRSRDTTPEVMYRKALWSKGLRYRKNPTDMIGKPDIALPSSRIAVFIDGDFWHGGQWRRRNLRSLEDQFEHTKTKDYWPGKIMRNMARDCRATATLLKDGWVVLRLWESHILHSLEACVDMTLQMVREGSRPSPFALLPQKTFAEFFAGIGLMRMGLERQGWVSTFANDLDPQKREMFQGHFNDPDGFLLPDDIHQLPVESVPTVSLATASFPCNDLSLAGARCGLHGKESSAFWGFVRVLEEMEARRPPLILLENVTGFLTSDKGRDFEKALLSLNRLGYDVDAFMLDAACFVPQSRPRLFVVGVLDDGAGSLMDFTLSPYGESDVRPKALSSFIRDHPHIRWRIRSLPAQPGCDKTLADILEDLPATSPEWWSPERADYLFNQMSPRHREVADRMIAGNDYTYGTVFRRIRNQRSMAELRTDGIAGCLRTPRGGSGRQILFKAGKGRYFARLVTPRECARLMGADDYRITVPLNQALFGFGDAVCVPVVEWIARYYLNPLINELIRGKALTLQLAEGRP